MTRDDLLGALGLETRKTVVDYALPLAGIFSAGLLVGAGIGMMFAPKSGRELRSDIMGRVRAAPIRAGGERAEQAVYAPER